MIRQKKVPVEKITYKYEDLILEEAYVHFDW